MPIPWLMIYCLVPQALAAELLEPLRAHFAGDPGVEVRVDRRSGGRRRSGPERLDGKFADVDRRGAQDRRRPVIPRRFDDRLPPELAPRAGQLRWEQRLAPVGGGLEDAPLEDLLRLGGEGSDAAISELYWRHVARVRTRLVSLLGRREPAEEATRVAWGRVLDALPGHPPRVGSWERFLDMHADAVALELGAART